MKEHSVDTRLTHYYHGELFQGDIVCDVFDNDKDGYRKFSMEIDEANCLACKYWIFKNLSKVDTGR